MMWYRYRHWSTTTAYCCYALRRCRSMHVARKLKIHTIYRTYERAIYVQKGDRRTHGMHNGNAPTSQKERERLKGKAQSKAITHVHLSCDQKRVLPFPSAACHSPQADQLKLPFVIDSFLFTCLFLRCVHSFCATKAHTRKIPRNNQHTSDFVNGLG